MINGMRVIDAAIMVIRSKHKPVFASQHWLGNLGVRVGVLVPVDSPGMVGAKIANLGGFYGTIEN
jgi:hypothetical protein